VNLLNTSGILNKEFKLTITKSSPSIAVTAEGDLTEANIKEAVEILLAGNLITDLDFTSGGVTVTLSISGSTVTISDGTSDTTMVNTNHVGIAGTIIAFLAL